MKWPFVVVVVLGTLSSAMTPSRQAPAKPQMVKVPYRYMAEIQVREVNPKYPREAREKHIQGDVVLQVHIDEHGSVYEVKPISGEKILTGAAIDAVKQWRYQSFMFNGENVKVETVITIHFKL